MLHTTQWFTCVLIATVACLAPIASGDTPIPRHETLITFTGYDRAETLADFPVLVPLNTSISGFSYADFVSPGDGADLRFRRADNDQELDYELENWDTNGTSHAWVRVDSLTNDTAIYAMWGNPGWTNAPPCRTNGAVWNSSYEAVWHMNETVVDESTQASVHRDFTAHGRNGTQVGNAATAGRVAQGQYLDGTGDYINVPDSIVSSSNLTISTWMRPDTLSGWGVIINQNSWDVSDIHYQFYNATLGYHLGGGFDVGHSGFSFTAGAWHHVVAVYDRSAGGSDGTLTFYVDGLQRQVATGLTTTLNPTPTPGRIGSWDGGGRDFHGAMDEFRILSTAPSANRVWATWLNMASNDHFNTYGEVEYHPDTLIHYVSPGGGHVHPYASWADAATNIQDAIDAATAGDTVLVTNGTYSLPTTITVTRSLTLASVNGAGATIISGGGRATCLNLANHAVVVNGFTIRDGYTRTGNGGGIACSDNTPIITNCIVTANTAFHGAGAYRGTLNVCQIVNNTCRYSGGGTCLSILSRCTVSGNTCEAEGGGVYYGTAYHCTIADNRGGWGGGTAFVTLYNCTVRGNRSTAYYGGGVYYGTAYNCIIVGNHGTDLGGGSAYGTRYNCVISGNSSSTSGGGSYYSNLHNCTITDNTAAEHAGGTHYGNVYNSIIVDNYVGNSVSNWHNGAYTYTCTTPLPPGTGNTADDPMLLSRSHIATNSPCVGAGFANYATGTDIDGEPWNSPPSIGCDEVNPGAMGGPLAVSINAGRAYAYPNVQVDFVAEIDGKPTHTAWSLGPVDIFRVSSSWSDAGNYPVVLTAYNTDNPGGVAATVTVQVIDETMHYVSPSGNHVAPYSTWANAATSIHAAVDVACDGGSVVVADGTYPVSTEIRVETDIAVSSVNGADATIVDADGGCRVFNLGAQACTLSGLTISGGYASKGGGVYCLGTTPVVSNCTIRGNRGSNGAGAYRGKLTQCLVVSNSASHTAGGANRSYLENCLVMGNYAEEAGGGAYYSTLVNCTVVSNSASMGGSGVTGGTLTNCIVYHNTGWWDPNHSGGTWTDCCTIPVPFTSSRTITNDPQFVDRVSGDYRLGATSPCIDSATNVVGIVDDLRGAGRPLDGNNDGVYALDMGCYEYAHPAVDSDGDTIPDRFEADHGLNAARANASDNPDNDPHNNLQEYIADTDPTNADDCFRITTIRHDSPVTVRFDSSSSRRYTLQSCTELVTRGWSNVPGQVDVQGTGGPASLTDPSATSRSRNYRVQVKIP